jgi:hypothetical protein
MTYYIVHARRENPYGALQPSYDWQDHTRRALAWQYGEERACRIIAGKDAATNRDLQRWAKLGRSAA